MADFTYSGLDSLMSQLDYAAKLDISEEMLYQGADIIVDRVKDNIIRAGHVRTRKMLDNVKYKRKIKKGKDGVPYVSIASMKKDGQGKEARFNAYKAFWANYGTSNQIATHFWDKAEMEAEPEIEKAGNELIEKYYKEKGLTDNA